MPRAARDAAPDLDLLERRWRATAPIDDGTIHLLVVRVGNGRHDTPARLELSPEDAVAGDRWPTDPRGFPDTQVSLIERRVVELVAGPDRSRWHLPGDNLVVDLDLSLAALPVGTHLRAGTARIEITAKPHTGCTKFRARLGDEAFRWVNAPEHRDRRLRGVYARVVAPGIIAATDRVVRG
ncbi:MAG TPA: MOSC domain-containing protein [Kofleriaceae bacterium]|nr:MOSC domain-containing protein [Kofleriaceae bacterium]